VQVAGRGETGADEIDLVPERGNTVSRLLLEGVQDVHGLGKVNSVDGPVCIAVMVLNDLPPTVPPKPRKGLAATCLPPDCA